MNRVLDTKRFRELTTEENEQFEAKGDINFDGSEYGYYARVLVEHNIMSYPNVDNSVEVLQVLPGEIIKVGTKYYISISNDVNYVIRISFADRQLTSDYYTSSSLAEVIDFYNKVLSFIKSFNPAKEN